MPGCLLSQLIDSLLLIVKDGRVNLRIIGEHALIQQARLLGCDGYLQQRLDVQPDHPTVVVATGVLWMGTLPLAGLIGRRKGLVLIPEGDKDFVQNIMSDAQLVEGL